MGCGDDDENNNGGTGGGGSSGSAGKAGSGGKSGSGGKAGSSGGAAVTPAACTTATTALLKDQPGALPAMCISCICEENAKAVTDCNGNANCWKLIACVAEKCDGASDQTKCATDNCITYIGGATTAMAAGALIQGMTCAAKCGATDMDAGMDAGN